MLDQKWTQIMQLKKDSIGIRCISLYVKDVDYVFHFHFRDFSIIDQAK